MANIVTVTALNTFVKTLLEANEVLTDIAIRGEISNFVNHQKTGHFYFSLKDEKCSVKAVMFKWSNQAISFMPQTGMNVVVSGKISLYERDGSFQIYVEKMFLDGEGAIKMAFDQLKLKLESEGLFDVCFKKPLPTAPQRIGVVTSKTGAALQDIINVLSRRCPLAQLVLCPATVQGETAHKEISLAIKTLDKKGNCDVIIVARGGGSAEDLWVFNHEEIARTVFACKTPIISGIGHEIDFTILDFVADMRAPTPSAAAEIATLDIQDMYKKCIDLCKIIQKSIYLNWDMCYNNLSRLTNSNTLKMVADKPIFEYERLEKLKKLIQAAANQKYEKIFIDFANKANLASVLNPYAVLKRGYTVASYKNHPIACDNLPQNGEEIAITGDRFFVQANVINSHINDKN